MDHDDPKTLPPEPVEERPSVGTVTPEDYPEGDRAGSVSDRPLDEDKEYERLNPGSVGHTPSVPDRGRDRDNA